MHALLLPIRQHELLAVRPLLGEPKRVLELGAGNGWQAAQLAALGHDVQAVDVAVPHGPSFFPVQTYDGIHLPLPAASVDVIYSSNVLEHVKELSPLLEEMKRVLVADGYAVHVLPSPVWRAWTSMAWYPALLRRFLSRTEDKDSADVHSTGGNAAPGGLHRVKRALVEPPHGEFTSALSELWHYRAFVWRRKFANAGFVVSSQRPGGLFYTGYGLSTLSMRQRERLATVLGSACTVFVLRAGS